MTTLSIQTTTLSNETLLLKEEIQTFLDQMFDEASSSSKVSIRIFDQILICIIAFSLK